MVMWPGLAKLLEDWVSPTATADQGNTELLRRLQTNKPKNTSVEIRQSPENLAWATSGTSYKQANKPKKAPIEGEQSPRTSHAGQVRRTISIVKAAPRGERR